MPRLNFDNIKSHALTSAEKVASHWVPNGSKDGHEWVGLNPTRDDKNTGSFSVNLNTWIWKDFSSGDGGKDLIALVAYVDKCNQKAAAEALCKFLGLSDAQAQEAPTAGKGTKKKSPSQAEFKPIFPPPADAAKDCPSKHPRNGEPVLFWDYLSPDGVLLIRVMRFEKNTDGERKKDFRPLAWGALGKQQPRWHWRQLPDKRPLYRLQTLKGQDTTVICEGEKAADACAALFPSWFVTSWSGGAKAIDKTDFSPLKDRHVIVWPDNDNAGQQTIQKLKARIHKAGAKKISIINMAFFANNGPTVGGKWETGGKWPEKADAFEAVAFGWTDKHLANALADGVLLEAEATKSLTEYDDLPFGFTMDETGLYHMDEENNRRRLCQPIHVLAESRNSQGRDWGLLIRFKDADHLEKVWNIPNQLFSSDNGQEIVRGLLDRGIKLNSGRNPKKKVLEYLQDYRTDRRMALAYNMGWYEQSFVLPDSVIGQNQDVLYYSEGPALCKPGVNGSLSGWKDKIARYCQDNPLALFAVSAAFSAPLVEVVGYEPMGFHFFGDSSWGKSTLLDLACSVYGNPERYKCTFRATDNALESLASAHSGMLFALDEINQVDPKAIGDIIYMLGNGQGKHRANDRGQARETQHRWKLTYLSNGEKNLSQYIGEAGKKVTGGMEMRFLGIRATQHDDEAKAKHLGVFNTSHHFPGGADLSDHLKKEMQNHYGVAFPVFIEFVLKQGFENLSKEFRFMSDEFSKLHVKASAGGQVKRAATKFALVGLAGELATRWNITGWQKGQSYLAARDCFNAWIKARGGQGNMEDKQTLDEFRLQIERYGYSHFKRWDQSTQPGTKADDTTIDEHTPSPSEMWGFRRHFKTNSMVDGNTQENVYFIYPNAFEKVICQGHDHKRVARLLRDIEALELTESDEKRNRLKTRVRIPGTGKHPIYVYKVNGGALFNAKDTEED